LIPSLKDVDLSFTHDKKQKRFSNFRFNSKDGHVSLVFFLLFSLVETMAAAGIDQQTSTLAIAQIKISKPTNTCLQYKSAKERSRTKIKLSLYS
jgi:hypothetical protein